MIADRRHHVVLVEACKRAGCGRLVTGPTGTKRTRCLDCISALITQAFAPCDVARDVRGRKADPPVVPGSDIPRAATTAP